MNMWKGSWSESDKFVQSEGSAGERSKGKVKGNAAIVKGESDYEVAVIEEGNIVLCSPCTLKKLVGLNERMSTA